MVNTGLQELDADFGALYSVMGRDSIPPEKLLESATADGGVHDSH